MTKRLDEIEARAEAVKGDQWKREGAKKFNHGQTIWSGPRRLWGNGHECTEAEFDFVL